LDILIKGEYSIKKRVISKHRAPKYMIENYLSGQEDFLLQEDRHPERHIAECIQYNNILAPYDIG
jgi:hypothetical protein